MSGRPSHRVYFVEHHDGRLTGVLVPRWDAFFDRPPPIAYGPSQAVVLQELEIELRQREADGERRERYLWTEPFTLRQIDVDVHPESFVRRRRVVGRRSLSLRFHYVSTPLADGGFRVMLPRFGWWLVLESLEIARDVLRSAVGTFLAGAETRSLYDLREQAAEYVMEWFPKLAPPRKQTPSGDAPPPPTLSRLADELVEKAVRRRLSLPAGGSRRPPEPGLLEERPPPSLLLVGGPGVGKSTWVHGLADLFGRRRGATQHPPPRIWRLPGEQFLAGMVYLGQWQQRVLDAVEELRHEGDYLYVDRLTSILQRQPDGACVADFLLGPLQAGEVSLIAECSELELQHCRERAPALLAHMRIIRLEEPEGDEIARQLTLHLAVKAPWLSLDPGALRTLVRLLAHYQRHVCFPGKAVRFVDALATGYRKDAERQTPRRLGAAEIANAFSRQTGLPVEILSDEVPLDSASIAASLSQRVIGQDEACRTAARVLTRLKAGIDDPDKPVGSLLFAGPTGVGKTELSKQLARFLFGDESRMVRVDMSELMLPGSAQRLLWAGAGAQSLAARVRRQPLSLVLLDEIEKAHADVFDLLLGVLGEGRLTDSLGRLVDFRMTLIVMTSNIGTSDAAAVGFSEDGGPHFRAEVQRYFRPEFFNRLDAVVGFRPLRTSDIERIVDLELERAAARTGLNRRRIRLNVTAAARARLAELGYDPRRGARPLKRVVEERVVTPVAVRLASAPDTADREILVTSDVSSPAQTDSGAWVVVV